MVNNKAMTDEQLVRAYIDGSNEAFDALLKRHQMRVYNYILRVVKNEDVANDIFQETFVKAIMTIKQGRYTESGKSSITTVRKSRRTSSQPTFRMLTS